MRSIILPYFSNAQAQHVGGRATGFIALLNSSYARLIVRMGCAASILHLKHPKKGMQEKPGGKIYPEPVIDAKRRREAGQHDLDDNRIAQDGIIREAAKAQAEDAIRRQGLDTSKNNMPAGRKKRHSLIKAAKNGDLSVVNEILLDISTNKANSRYNIDMLGMWDNTPLICACQYRHETVAIALLKNGANPNAMNEKGCTPLLHAAVEGCTRTVETLLEHGADPNLIEPTPIYNQAMDVHGSYTPLLASVTNGFSTIASLLLRHKASVNVKTNEGQSILEIAIHTSRCEKTILAIAPYCTNEMWSQGNNREYILAKYNESGGKEYSEIAAILTREDPTMIKDDPEKPMRPEEDRASAMVVKEVVEAEEEGHID